MKINIDKLFQNIVKESRITAPDGVWSAVETNLKRRRMLRFLSWFFGVSFLSLIGFMFLFSQAEKTSDEDIHKNTTSKEFSKNKIETSIDNKDAFSQKYKKNQIKSQTKKATDRNLSINIIKGKATGINKTTDVENISLAAKKGETTFFTSESKNNQHIKNKKIVINYINSLGGCKSCADYLWVAATFSNSAYQSAPNFRMRASFTNL